MTAAHVLTASELAARWKVSEASVKRRLVSGEWPSFRVGRRRLVPLQWVRSYEAGTP